MLRRIAVGLMLVFLAFWPVHAFAQSSLWETYIAAGTKAYQEGNFPEAEKQWGAALNEAEGFGLEEPPPLGASR